MNWRIIKWLGLSGIYHKFLFLGLKVDLLNYLVCACKWKYYCEFELNISVTK